MPDQARLRIGCLHTARSNIDIFADAAAALPVELIHDVRPELLAAAEDAGGLTEDIRAGTRLALAELAGATEAVVLTCSTLGSVAENCDTPSQPVLRADAALAEAALAVKGRVIVLCAAPTTLEPTADLFRRMEAGGTQNLSKEIRLVEGAWRDFREGRTNAYHLSIATAADRAFAEGADGVALAQVSMAPAAAYMERGKPLTVPPIALRAALERGAVNKAGENDK